MKEDWQYHWNMMFNPSSPEECFKSYWWLQSKANPIGPKEQKNWSVKDAQKIFDLFCSCTGSVLQYQNELLQKKIYNGSN